MMRHFQLLVCIGLFFCIGCSRDISTERKNVAAKFSLKSPFPANSGKAVGDVFASQSPVINRGSYVALPVNVDSAGSFSVSYKFTLQKDLLSPAIDTLLLQDSGYLFQGVDTLRLHFAGIVQAVDTGLYTTLGFIDSLSGTGIHGNKYPYFSLDILPENHYEYWMDGVKHSGMTTAYLSADDAYGMAHLYSSDDNAYEPANFAVQFPLFQSSQLLPVGNTQSGYKASFAFNTLAGIVAADNNTKEANIKVNVLRYDAASGFLIIQFSGSAFNSLTSKKSSVTNGLLRTRIAF